MATLLLALCLFAYLSVLGRATFALLGVRFGRGRTWLIAPSLGLSVVSLLVMVLNQAGWPIAAFARILAGATFAGSLFVLWRRHILPPRTLLPFAIILIAALLLGGWPALMYGWNWIGYGNDDMTNYCLGAERFLRQEFYAIPTPADLAGGFYPSLYWVLHIAAQIRFGSEQAVAWLAGITDLKVIEAFMPTLLALALTQLSTIMGLAWSGRRGRSTALAAGFILGFSPLWYAGLMYQLIAQVAGLALLAAIAALAYRCRFPHHWRGRLRLGVASALLISALSIYYPEVIPFLVLGWGVFLAQRIWRVRRLPAGLVATAGFAFFLTFVFLRHNALSTILTLLGQSQEGLDAQAAVARVSLFPYFLIPGGPAFLCGFDFFVNRHPEPWTSVAQIGGFLGLAAMLLIWLQSLRLGAVSAAILAVMIPVGVLLFSTRNGFGLFKLCMFALPFLAITLAQYLESRSWRRWTWVVYGLLATVWLPGIWRYSLPTTCLNPGQSSELLNASFSRGHLPGPATPVWAATTSAPINKLLMLEAPSNHPVFLSQLVGLDLMGKAARPFPAWVWRCLPGNATGEIAVSLVRFVDQQVYHRQKAHGLTFWARTTADQPADPATVLVSSAAEKRSFNKIASDRAAPSAGLFDYAPLADLNNHLIFVQTFEGHHYYLGEAGSIAVYRPQPDIYQPDDYFFAIGRHLLFRVINPSEKFRLRLAITASILGEGRTDLPQGAVVRHGEAKESSLGLVGAGSARIFSAPLQPAPTGGVSYVAIDLGRPPIALGLPAKRLHGIYRRELSLDTRLALGYCRDISLVSESEYADRVLPREIARFPEDLLTGKFTEYSGIYEDGWIAQEAFVKLGPVKAGDRLVIKGVHARPASAEQGRIRLSLLLDDKVAQVRELDYGDFELQAGLDQTGTELKVGLRADRITILPDPDNRPVSILLHSIRLQSTP